jgi:hypothetical protein
MPRYEYAFVKWFDSRDNRRYGFLHVAVEDEDRGFVATEEEVFFHFNDGQLVRPGGNVPELCGASGTVFGGMPHVMRDPKPGDLIMFQRKAGSQGRMKASPWVYKDHWDEAENVIAARPVYRARETMNSLGTKPGEPKVLWQGPDLQEALKKFPVPARGRSISADPLIPYWTDSDNIFEVRHWWEVRRPDGSWTPCSDPRS